MDEVERIVIPAGEYITLEDAARLAGYSSAGNLRTAAANGRLHTIAIGRHCRITTEAWLQDYLAGLAGKEGWPRGKSRKEQP